MGGIRRSAIAFLACANWQTAAAQPQELVLGNPAGPASLRIANPGPGPVVIQGVIGVEERNGAAWIRLGTEFHAIASCAHPGGPGPVQIAARSTLDVVPWLGYSCSGQCETACRANIYFGPNTFRFVVTMLPSGSNVVGPVFSLPAETMRK